MPALPKLLIFPITLIPVLTGCGIVPHYGTAKLARHGEWQITPAITIHAFGSSPRTGNDSEEDLEVSGSGISLGAAGTYGVTDALNLAVRYEHFPHASEAPHFLHGELKIGIERDRAALSVGYGQLLGTGIHQATLNGFVDYPLHDGIVFCVSPQGSVLFTSEGPVGIVDASLNGSFSWPATPQLTLMPQAGIALTPLLFNIFAVKLGFAGRYTF